MERITTAYKWLCVEILFLVALGAGVRAMDAGLACPDWPLCFGDFIPDYHPQVYFEFIHRALAGIVGIVTITLNIMILRRPELPKSLKSVAVFSSLLLLAQVVMGGLTVLLKLHDKVVATHLALGTAFFATSLWIYLSLRFAQGHLKAEPMPTPMRWITVGLVGGTYGQLLLGGLVASNYAALVCGNDFPLCHGKLIPTLENLIGIHVSHRLGAYSLVLAGICYFFYTIRNCACPNIRKLSKYFVLLLGLQILVGIANVKFLTPPLITVIHLAVGTMMLGVAVSMVRFATLKPRI